MLRFHLPLVKPDLQISPVYRWIREEQARKQKSNPKGGQRKPREVRELIIEIALTRGFGYTKPHSQYAALQFA